MDDNRPRFEVELDHVMDEMKAIMLRKRDLRGHENITRQGLTGVVNRALEDKLARVRRGSDLLDLRARLVPFMQQDVIDEYIPHPDTLDDTSLRGDMLDLANYMIIGAMLQEGTWDSPTRKEAGDHV